MVRLAKTDFRGVLFKGCKMLGLRFETCSTFGLSFGFEDCTLNYSSFFQTNIKKTRFKNVLLQEVDFTECQLTGSVFDNCDMTRAIFEKSVLESVDFRTSYRFSIDPSVNKMKKAKFSANNLLGLLDRFDLEIFD
jgi:fluoroquinolone resistance protein